MGNTTQLGSLPAASGAGTTLCRDNTTNEIVQCPANAAGVSLQLAYEAGNTISASDSYGDLGITLSSGNSRQFTVTNAGNASSAFVINDTNAANHNALAIQSNGTTNLSINENGNITTNGTLSSGAITTSGNLTFGGVAPNITTSSNENLTLSPNGTGEIILGNTTQLGAITTTTNSATTLCRDNTTNEIVQCPANALNVTLQQAYNAGNSITTNDGSNIAFTLAGGLTTPTSFTLTNAGTGNAFIINDTNAATNTALAIQSNGITNLSINENGNLSTSGNIATTGTGTVTSAGALTVTSGGASVTGGLNNNTGGITNTGAIAGATDIALSVILVKQVLALSQPALVMCR